jgi:branched-chain amino acid transport system permease protein
MSKTGRIIGLLVLLCVLAVVPIVLHSAYWLHVLILAGVNVLLAVSLRLIYLTGQISMGSAGFMLLGGYASALLARNVGLSFWLTIIIGGIFAALVAVIAAWPFLKAKGIYFAILTVLLAEVCRLVAWYWESLTGGSSGLRNIPDPNTINVFGWFSLSFDTPKTYYYLLLVLLLISLIIIYRLERSWLGSMWSAIRESESLARSVGINVMLHKIVVFTVAAFFMGLAGALYAHYMGSLSPAGTPGSVFSFTASIYVLIYLVVGGAASFAGPIVGAFVLSVVFELGRSLDEYMPLILGGLLIVVAMAVPEGIVGLASKLALSRRRLFVSLGGVRRTNRLE